MWRSGVVSSFSRCLRFPLSVGCLFTLADGAVSGWQLWGHYGREREKHSRREVVTLRTDSHLTFLASQGLSLQAWIISASLLWPSDLWTLTLADCCCHMHLPEGLVFITSEIGCISPACGVKIWLLRLTSGALQILTFTWLSKFVFLKLLQSLDSTFSP